MEVGTIIAAIGGAVAFIVGGSVGVKAFWKWIKDKIDRDSAELMEMRKQRDSEFNELKVAVEQQTQLIKDLTVKLATAQAELEYVRKELHDALEELKTK